MSTNHLCNAKAMSEVVEGYLVVIFIGLIKEVAKSANINSKFGTEVEIEVHLLQK